jgi:hypothetical protein
MIRAILPIPALALCKESILPATGEAERWPEGKRRRQRLPAHLPRAHGRQKRTTNWYIEYVVGGRAIREATEYAKRSDAVEFLKKRVSDALNGKIVLSNQVTFDDLKNLIINDYRNNGRKSLASTCL